METIRNGDAYSRILREEIMPAAGCSDLISIAYCAAKAHEVLGMQPTAVTVSVSDNVLKNFRNVAIPNTNGLIGIRAAVAAGIVCGDVDKGMQVIDNVSDEQHAAIVNFMDSVRTDVSCAETKCEPYISITLYARTTYARVVIANSHFNIVEIMKNGEALLKRSIVSQNDDRLTDRSCLNLRDIMAYVENVDLADIQDLLDMQISYNMAICEEGLKSDYGANIGKILLSENVSDAKSVAKAYAAAGSDARMNGCEMPVAVLCGSGTQGIVASVPIACYAKHYSIGKERTYRALILSDLLTIYQKAYVGHSAAYCGAINAGCAVSAGIAYLLGGDETAVACTLTNAIDMNDGMVCDGAKPTCSAKVAAAIDTDILGYQMYLHNCQEAVAVPDADAAIRGIMHGA